MRLIEINGQIYHDKLGVLTAMLEKEKGQEEEKECVAKLKEETMRKDINLRKLWAKAQLHSRLNRAYESHFNIASRD